MNGGRRVACQKGSGIMKVDVTANGKSAELTSEHAAATKESPVLMIDGLAYDPGEAYMEGVVVEGPEEHPLVMRWRERSRLLNGTGTTCAQCGYVWASKKEPILYCPYCGAEV